MLVIMKYSVIYYFSYLIYILFSVSYAGDGDENFYLTLSQNLAEKLSQKTVEWNHTYGLLVIK